MAPNTVLLIHGLWMTPLSWEHWVSRYEQRGLTVITPGYPGIEPGEAGVEAIRNDPSPLAGLGVREIVDQLSEVIEALDEPPIIMGHSFGGAFVQLLLDAGYGAAGVSINGAGVKGIKATPFSEIKATFPVLHNPANKNKAVPITEKDFHYAITNNLSDEESKAVYDRYSIPASGRMKYELRRMREQGSGAIVNCSSQSGLVGTAGLGAYTASKHGVIGLTRSAALEYAPQGVRVNAICPGTSDTPMVAQAVADAPEHMAAIVNEIPLGRLGQAEEIASAVLWLCSPGAGFTVGQAIVIDGGYTVR